MLAPFSGKIIVLVLIILFIQKRPRGLFASRAGRSRHDDVALFAGGVARPRHHARHLIAVAARPV